jgi:hypothetical protein
MTTLAELATVVKSANAGASWLTFDIELPSAEALRRLLSGTALNPTTIAERLHVDSATVTIYVIEPLNAVKVTVPRRYPRCGQAERDFDGVQQFVPLLDLEVGA